MGEGPIYTDPEHVESLYADPWATDSPDYELSHDVFSDEGWREGGRSSIADSEVGENGDYNLRNRRNMFDIAMYNNDGYTPNYVDNAHNKVDAPEFWNEINNFEPDLRDDLWGVLKAGRYSYQNGTDQNKRNTNWGNLQDVVWADKYLKNKRAGARRHTERMGPDHQFGELRRSEDPTINGLLGQFEGKDAF